MGRISQVKKDRIAHVLRVSDLDYKTIAKRFGVSDGSVSLINKETGARPLKQNPAEPQNLATGKIPQEKIDQVVNLLRSTTWSYAFIAQQVGLGISSVLKINKKTGARSYPSRERNEVNAAAE